jgi:hypothetical protein
MLLVLSVSVILTRKGFCVFQSALCWSAIRDDLDTADGSQQARRIMQQATDAAALNDSNFDIVLAFEKSTNSVLCIPSDRVSHVLRGEKSSTKWCQTIIYSPF